MKIELELNDKKVSIPQDFTWKQWLRMGKFKEEDLNNTNLIHICTGLDISDIKKANLEQVNYIGSVLTNFYFAEEPKGEVYTTFEYEGVEYGLQKDFSKLSYGSWVDLEVYSADEVNKNIPKIMANLYYPVIGKEKDKYILEPYDDKKVESRSKLFEELPMKYWYGASTFFLLFVNQYMDAMLSSLRMKNKIESLMIKGLKVLPKFLQKRLLPVSTLKQFKYFPKRI